MKKGQIKLVIFDIGQTLLISIPSSEKVLLERCHQISVDVALEDLKRGCKVAELWTARIIMQEMKHNIKIPDEEFNMKWDYIALGTALRKSRKGLEILVERIQGIHGPLQTWHVHPETHEVLSELKKKGLALGVVSNFAKTLPDLCRETGIYEYFHFIIASESVGVAKPNPEILRIALRLAQVKPMEAVYVGDHSFDILCAKGVPMPVIWFNEDNDRIPYRFSHSPDHKIQTLRKLLELILV